MRKSEKNWKQKRKKSKKREDQKIEEEEQNIFVQGFMKNQSGEEKNLP